MESQVSVESLGRGEAFPADAVARCPHPSSGPSHSFLRLPALLEAHSNWPGPFLESTVSEGAADQGHTSCRGPPLSVVVSAWVRRCDARPLLRGPRPCSASAARGVDRSLRCPAGQCGAALSVPSPPPPQSCSRERLLQTPLCLRVFFLGT